MELHIRDVSKTMKIRILFAGLLTLTLATRYWVGSITKMFTAAMIFHLVEEGKLKLTDTLDKFFPQISNAKKITVAHIIAHRMEIQIKDKPLSLVMKFKKLIWALPFNQVQRMWNSTSLFEQN